MFGMTWAWGDFFKLSCMVFYPSPCNIWTFSSDGWSRCLINIRSRVQVPEGPLAANRPRFCIFLSYKSVEGESKLVRLCLLALLRVRFLRADFCQRDRVVKVAVLKTDGRRRLVGSNPTVGVVEPESLGSI